MQVTAADVNFLLIYFHLNYKCESICEKGLTAFSIVACIVFVNLYVTVKSLESMTCAIVTENHY